MNIFSKLFSFLKRLAFSKTARNVYLVFFGNGLSVIFAFVFFQISFRNMRLEDFGYFSALLSLLLLVTDIADIGIGSSLSAFLPPLESQKKKLLSFLKTAFFFQLSIAVGVSLIIFIFSPNIADWLFHTGKLTYLVQVTSLGMLAAILAAFFQNALSARQKFLQVSFLSAFSSITRVIFLIILIFAAKVFLVNVVWLQSINFIILAILAFILVDIEFLRMKKNSGDFKKLISFTSYLGIARGLTAIASKLDVLMLIAITNATEAGVYSIASRVISIYPLLAGSFSMVIAPRISATQDKKFLRSFMYKVILVTIGLIGTILILILIAHPFMIILFTQKAELAVTTFQLLLVSMAFFVASIPPVSLVIYYLRKPHILTVNGLLQLIIVIVGNIIFIPKFGRLGPAYSLILAYGITLFTTSILAYYYFRKHEAQ
ncbi:oligosaccharide flippase family protein [Candidatus Gottesmanbacteria bacterium]|nr:oligosaccharide flippase family protein [Candidatus Gottesmanbacteria bacterium]